jgi:hypothetical protein
VNFRLSGDYLLWVVFVKITEVAQKTELLFSKENAWYWATFWATFSQTHLVTLAANLFSVVNC